MAASQSQDALFSGRQTTLFPLSKAQTSAITDMLADSDVQIFLRAAELLVSAARDQVPVCLSICLPTLRSHSHCPLFM